MKYLALSLLLISSSIGFCSARAKADNQAGSGSREGRKRQYVIITSLSENESKKIEINSEEIDVLTLKEKIAKAFNIETREECELFDCWLGEKVQFCICLYKTQKGKGLIRGKVKSGSVLFFKERHFNEKSDKNLEKALKDMNLELLKSSLEDSANFNLMFLGPGGEISTAVCYASLLDWFDGVNTLIEAGADANLEGEGDSRPIHLAEKLTTLKSLIAAGAKVNEEDENNCTALHIACRANDLKRVKFLIESGAGVNPGGEFIGELIDIGAERSQRGITCPSPLDWAVLRGNLEMVKLLLDSGANVNEQQDEMRTEFLFSSEEELESEDEEDPKKTEEFKFSALHLAVLYGHDEIENCLLDRGADREAIA